MTRHSVRKALILSLLALLAAPLAGTRAAEGLAGERGRLLWEIGPARGSGAGAGFALAPDGYRSFDRDGFFVVGRSDPRRDWPYVQPGPGDTWAGSRRHTFTVVFGVKAPPPGAGVCRLELALTDTQPRRPPLLRVALNGHAETRALPAGGDDRSIAGHTDEGKRHRLEVAFPAAVLKPGANALTLTTLSGSWMLFDRVRFEAPAGVEPVPVPAEGTIVCSVSMFPAVKSRDGHLYQTARLTLCHLGRETPAALKVGDEAPVALTLRRGIQDVEVLVPDVSSVAQVPVVLEAGGTMQAAETVSVAPARKLTVYILPHSHTDIGYTEIQTRIEQKQVDNLLQGVAFARKTAGYPEGARFVWNVEVLWAADLSLSRLSEAQRRDLLDAVKTGQVALQGMYLNELTGLCRPEELLRLFRRATVLAERTGVPIDSAMISDVPGYTWGTVTAMAQAGIRYFSAAPNYFDRIGDILVRWENRPFYWVAPSGKEQVLVWIPFQGYGLSHRIGSLSPAFVEDYLRALDQAGYPYDIAYIRWAGHGDNAVPDPSICEFVRDWNAEYAWPRFVIASTSTAFQAFERRHGATLPQVRGDWTPYWEDGAGSSALETGMNRASADRLTQAETLWALRDPAGYPAADFEDAWRNVLLYSEHTWGADCSITDPASPKTREQWQIKQSYAARADVQSRQLVVRALADRGPIAEPVDGDDAVDVFNTTSWPRTEVVLVPRGISMAGDHVTDASGQPVPSQRLASGDLALLVRDLKPLAGRRYRLAKGHPHRETAGATVSDRVLDNGLIRVRVDDQSGGVVELRARGIDANLADTTSGHALNDFLYLVGDDPAQLQSSGPVTIRTHDPGPLVASLLVDSSAPGCYHLRREVRLTAGQEHVELINTVDKKRIVAEDYKASDSKESVNFAFPFHVPEGRMLLDLPIGAFRPETDQMPGACKNWLTVGRWADVARADFGVTWVTLDAPLVELGEITATLFNSQTDPSVWRHTIDPTQQLYSWAMNNHWGTNYRAYQEGPVTFRYALRPHRGWTPADASRLATGLSQPLIVTPARGPKPRTEPLLTLSTDDVMVTALKPSDDGKAWIVRLYGAAGRDGDVTLAWASPAPQRISLSDTSERPLKEAGKTISVPAWAVVTLRAERGPP
jgi:hypothetical protein